MFARYVPLVSVKAYVSCFRIVEGQLSSNISDYQKEMDIVCAPDKRLKIIIRLVRQIRRISKVKKGIPGWLRPYFFRLLSLLDKQKYCAVEISTDDDINFYEGDYYSVSSKLEWQSSKPTPK